jgi:C-terminal peptidase prc
MHKKIKPLSALVLSATLTLTAHAQDQDKNYWKDSGLTLQEFIDKTAPDCNTDKIHVLGCVESLNYLAAFAKPAIIFGTAKEQVANSYQFGSLISTSSSGLNEYAVPQNPPKFPTDEAEGAALRKKIKTLHVQEIESLAGRSLKNDWIALFTQMKTAAAPFLAAHPDVESGLTADLFNTNLAIIKDPHTQIWSTEEVADSENGVGTTFVGIGVYIDLVDIGLKITSIYKNSPAYVGELNIGDTIIEVDGQSLAGKKVEDAAKLLRGPVDSTVNVKVKRGSQELSFALIRKKIEEQNIEWSIVNDNGTPYGYIKLRDFMEENEAAKIAVALTDLKFSGVKGIIFDLRDNGGGDANNARFICDIFMGRKLMSTLKPLMTDEKKTQSEIYKTATGQTLYPEIKENGIMNAIDDKIPMITLINGDTASASEMTAGALQDYQRSWILGDRSYGKGSAQDTQGGFDDHPNVALRVTNYRFYEPSGRTNQVVGIIPDFYVDPVPHATADQKYVEREEDNYMSLPPQSKKWREPAKRQAKIDKINECRAQRAKAGISADDHYKQQSVGARLLPDYRLLTAEDVLSCQ